VRREDGRFRDAEARRQPGDGNAHRRTRVAQAAQFGAGIPRSGVAVAVAGCGYGTPEARRKSDGFAWIDPIPLLKYRKEKAKTIGSLKRAS